MCLTVNITFPTKKDAQNYKPLIATKDIKVYKVLEYGTKAKTKAKTNKDRLYSPYRGFYYDKGTQYTESKLNRRYHTTCWSNQCTLHIEKGLHAYVTKDCRQIKDHLSTYAYAKPVVVVMVIPKGSQYYLGDNNDIVTNNLIWY